MSSETYKMPGKDEYSIDEARHYTSFSRGILGFGDRFSVPPGASIVPLSDVLKLQDRHMKKSKSKTEFIFLKQGWLFCGMSGVICGAIFNMHFRRLMFLDKQYLVLSHMFAAFLPAYPLTIAHKFQVTDRIRVNPIGCQLCYANRSAMYNVLFGAVTPGAFSIISSVLLSILNGYHQFPKFQLGNRAKFFKQFGKTCFTYASGSVYLLSAGVVAMYFIGFGMAYAEIHETQSLVSQLMAKFRPVDYVAPSKPEKESIEGGIRGRQEVLTDRRY